LAFNSWTATGPSNSTPPRRRDDDDDDDGKTNGQIGNGNRNANGYGNAQLFSKARGRKAGLSSAQQENGFPKESCRTPKISEGAS
jgi:hypothetical protein